MIQYNNISVWNESKPSKIHKKVTANSHRCSGIYCRANILDCISLWVLLSFCPADATHSEFGLNFKDTFALQSNQTWPYFIPFNCAKNSRTAATTASCFTSLLLVSQTPSQDRHTKPPLLLSPFFFCRFSCFSCSFSPIWIKTEWRITNTFWAARKGDEFGVLNRQAKPIT